MKSQDIKTFDFFKPAPEGEMSYELTPSEFGQSLIQHFQTGLPKQVLDFLSQASDSEKLALTIFETERFTHGKKNWLRSGSRESSFAIFRHLFQ